MRRMTALLMTALLGAAVGAAHGQGLTTVRVASGLARPIYVTHAPGDPSRLFIIEKQGRIRILKNGVLLTTPFLDIDPIVTGGTTTNSEQGLLGLAFHPDYQTNGKFYVNYTAVAGSGDTVVAQYTVSGNPDIANTTGTTIITFDQPQTNHNGGWIAFGPDGYLYIASGDGGNFNDQGTGHTEPGGNAQDITSNLLGKMLRVDVDGDDFPSDPNRNYRIPTGNPFVGVTGDDEIFQYGLRNPWRNAFDRQTGDLWIADVGQGAWEEVNFSPAGSGAGLNFGWRCKEGNANFNFDANCATLSLTAPIWVYDHAGKCSITGGYVYRGCAIPELQGTYFFADFCSNDIWSFRYTTDSGIQEFTNRRVELTPPGGLTINAITSFGEDYFGEIYICDQGTTASNGEIFKIIPVSPGMDTDGNGIPNTCEPGGCPADFDGSGFIDLDDYVAFVLAFEDGDESTDVDGSGFVDLDDFVAFVLAFEDGC
ncbi:MAG: PQQ-dependent sugar dehydrogenase [Phycisphaeraceae bacterium]|nr:PQQ-dependent sugar dehydrogenase [Phycisphaerae bacterium]MBX3392645.1 PQQ-dependent sugar dehydrogenase [Phycisphaeraceae bacterium]